MWWKTINHAFSIVYSLINHGFLTNESARRVLSIFYLHTHTHTHTHIHRKCGIRVIFTSCLCENPNERGRAFDSNNELFITRKTRIFIEIAFLTQIKNKNSRTWNRNWRLTRRDLLHQYFQSLSARSLKLKFFWAMRHLSVICSMCSCFLDAIQTRLGSNQLTQI